MVADNRPPRNHGPASGEEWSQNVCKYRHQSTDLSTCRSVTVNINGRFDSTYGRTQSILMISSIHLQRITVDRRSSINDRDNFVIDTSNDTCGKFSTKSIPSGRNQQVQNTTSCHNSGMINLNWTRISTVRSHATYKYPPHNTMPKSPCTNSNPLRISSRDTSIFSMVNLVAEKSSFHLKRSEIGTTNAPQCQVPEGTNRSQNR